MQIGMGDVECGIRNAIGTHEGRAFVAWVLQMLSYHSTEAHEASFEILDEFYYRLDLVKTPTPITPLLSTQIKGKGPQETVAWAWERPDGGRSFGYVGFHYHRNWKRPEYRRFAAQGVLWTLGLPIPAKGFDVQIDAMELEVRDGDRPGKKKP